MNYRHNLKCTTVTLCLLLFVLTTQAADKVSLFDILDALDFIPSERPILEEPVSEDLTCNQAIDKLLGQLPDLGSLFYIILNGWYMGEWGDYGSCLKDATDSQYVFVTINGNYTGPALMTRGAGGKFTPFSSKVGMCVPKQCTMDDMKSLDGHFTTMAQNVNWTNVSVDYYFASNVDNSVSLSTGGIITFIVIGCAVILGVVGTLLELTKIGDVHDLDYQKLTPLAKFKTVRQYEPILLQKKNHTTQNLLIMSALRNAMQMIKMPRAYQEARNKHDSQSTKHMSIFNGIKGLGIVYVVYGHTYFFSWYGVNDNPFELQTWKNNLLFTFIPGAFFTVPVLLYTAGFVCTYSFLSVPEEKQFTISNLFYYYFKKIFRLVPFYIFIIALGYFGLSWIGYGPIWQTYIQVMSGCEQYWWTNLIFINNFYPTNFDDKCMPWTWFIACYVQLSLILPFLLALYKYTSTMISTIIFAVLFVFFFGLNMELIITKDIGAIPAFNDQFYAEIFMRPYYQFPSYLLGVIGCLIYMRFIKETVASGQVENSISSRLLNLVKKNSLVRYPLYVLGLFLMLITLMGCHPYIKDTSSWSIATQGFYGTFAYTIFALGFSIFIIAALIGKASFIRFFFGGDIWSFFGNFVYPFYMFHPLMSLYYFLSMTTDQHLGHQMMFYCFCGNIIFSFIFGTIFAVFLDRPWVSAFLISHDIKMAYHSKDFDIDNFKLSNGGVLLGSYNSEAERMKNSNLLLSETPSMIKVDESKSTLFDISQAKSRND